MAGSALMIQKHDEIFLETAFKKYYFDNFKLFSIPKRPNEREFGYQKFNSGMIRHLSINTDEQLRLLLMTNVPSDVYCSNAYYTFPNLPMKDKDWKEADLIFDVDAKDLNLSCRPKHICQKCIGCNSTFQNLPVCPQCNSNKIESKSFPCIHCIDASKNEIQKLYKILTDDLNISESHIQTYFSGNEGFHVHVIDSDFQTWGSQERRFLSNYVSFKNVLPDRYGMKKHNAKKENFPSLDENGWRGRVAKSLFGSKSKRSKVISDMMAKDYTSFQNTLLEIAPKIGAIIDPNVTTDIHRVFRLAGSINSKSGLTKTHCDDIKKFDPYFDACFIDDTDVQVQADCPVSFKLKRTKFGPYTNEKVTLPRFAAVYLICKGFATSMIQ